MLNVVVLPAPFGPSNPTISPAPTVTETPLTTRRLPYSFTSFSVASNAPFDCEPVVSIYLFWHGQFICLFRRRICRRRADIGALPENHFWILESKFIIHPIPDDGIAGLCALGILDQRIARQRHHIVRHAVLHMKIIYRLGRRDMIRLAVFVREIN